MAMTYEWLELQWSGARVLLMYICSFKPRAFVLAAAENVSNPVSEGRCLTVKARRSLSQLSRWNPAASLSSLIENIKRERERESGTLKTKLNDKQRRETDIPVYPWACSRWICWISPAVTMTRRSRSPLMWQKYVCTIIRPSHHVIMMPRSLPALSIKEAHLLHLGSIQQSAFAQRSVSCIDFLLTLHIIYLLI